MAKKDSSPTPYFEVQVDAGRHIFFDDQESVDGWLNKLKEFHDFSREELPDTNSMHKFIRRVATETYGAAITELRNTVSKSAIARNKVIAQESAENFFSQKRLIDPSSKSGRLIENLRKSDPLAGAYALFLLTSTDGAVLPNFSGSNQPALSMPAAKAAVTTAMHEMGLATSYEEAISQISEIGQEKINHAAHSLEHAKDNFQTLSNHQQSLIDRAEAYLKSFKEMHSESSDIRDDLIKSAKVASDEFKDIRREFENHKSSIETEFDRLKEAFESQVKVHSAFQYWKDKESTHRSAARTQLNWIKGYALSVAVVVIISAFFFSDSTIKAISIGGLMFVTLLVLGAIWGGRVLAKLYLSQVNLAEDACERATLVKTFIALVREGGAKDAQMDIVLNALCRPATKGVGNDGNNPTLPIEAVVKKITE